MMDFLTFSFVYFRNVFVNILFQERVYHSFKIVSSREHPYVSNRSEVVVGILHEMEFTQNTPEMNELETD